MKKLIKFLESNAHTASFSELDNLQDSNLLIDQNSCHLLYGGQGLLKDEIADPVVVRQTLTVFKCPDAVEFTGYGRYEKNLNPYISPWDEIYILNDFLYEMIFSNIKNKPTGT